MSPSHYLLFHPHLVPLRCVAAVAGGWSSSGAATAMSKLSAAKEEGMALRA